MNRAFLGAALALLIPACTGGSEGAALQTSTLRGLVVEVDGQSNDVSGVDIKLVEKGEETSSAGDGSFSFHDLEPGTYTLDFAGKGNSDEPRGDDGFEHEGDEFEDGEGRPKIEVTEEGGDVEIRVSIEDGDIKEISVVCYECRHAMAKLFRREGAEESELAGSIQLSAAEGERFKVKVEGLEPETGIEIWIGDDFIDDVRANLEGEACYVAETGMLPLDAVSLDELAGLRLEVRLAGTDEFVLVGEIPDLPKEMERPRENDEEGEDGKNEPDGEEPNGEEPNGEEPNGEEPNGEEPNGEEPSGEEPNGEEPSGEEPDGDAI